jgi:hypothetical protein
LELLDLLQKHAGKRRGGLEHRETQPCGASAEG